MKHLLLLLAVLLSLTAQATPTPLTATPAHDSVQLRARYCASYLTELLQLSPQQAQAVRRFAAGQAAAPDPVKAWPRFDQQMLRILTAGQYATFALLTESLPR